MEIYRPIVSIWPVIIHLFSCFSVLRECSCLYRCLQEKRHAYCDKPISFQYGYLGHVVNNRLYTNATSVRDLAELLASWRFHVPSIGADFFNFDVGVNLHYGCSGLGKVNTNAL